MGTGWDYRGGAGAVQAQSKGKGLPNRPKNGTIICPRRPGLLIIPTVAVGSCGMLGRLGHAPRPFFLSPIQRTLENGVLSRGSQTLRCVVRHSACCSVGPDV